MNGRKYQIHGNIIRSEDGDDSAFMGITYWVDTVYYTHLDVYKRQSLRFFQELCGIINRFG